MKILPTLTTISACILIASCNSVSDNNLTISGPTNAEFIAANKACAAQAEIEKKERDAHWFEHWMTCQYTKIMPMETSVYHAKEKEITEMYKTLLSLAKDVDSGKTTVQEVYDKWDKMKDEIGMVPCALKSIGADGSQYCHFAGQSKR
ncbi:MAG: hypothetical protein IT497_04615 [Ottowia sp.]|nr:hypothetical protein [Ottowia sp.]